MGVPPASWTVGASAVLAAVLSAPSVAADAPHSRGWLGVAMGNAAPDPGVHVEHVVHGSPADKSGIRKDDRVLRVDGVAVANPPDFVRAVGLHSPGESVTLALVRAAKEQQLTIVLGDFPPLDTMLRMDHVGAPAPAWVGLTPMSGFPASMGSLRGHVVIVDFWATWCGPCHAMVPVLSGWQSRYAAQGLSVVGITTDPSEEAAVYRERNPMTYPIASDPRAETNLAYGVSALPTLFIIDKKGVVRDAVVGVAPEQDAHVEDLIKTLLAEPVAP